MPEPALLDPLIAGSEDSYIAAIFDIDKDPTSGQVTSTPVDLDDPNFASIHLLCWNVPDGDPFPALPDHEYELTPLDQTNFPGFARHRWVADYPTPGVLKVRARITKTDGTMHYSQVQHHRVEAI